MPEPIIVIGAGPAGMAAAATAAERGVPVWMLDDNPAPGGQIWRASSGKLHPRATPWVDRARRAGVRLLVGMTLVDADPESRHVIAATRTDSWHIPYRALVLATGARERFLPFPGWESPGVYGVGGLQALAKGGWPVVDRRIVVAGSGPLLLAVAAGLREAGARIITVLEQAPFRQVVRLVPALLSRPDKALQGATYRFACAETPYRTGTWVTRVESGPELTLTIRTRRGTETLRCDDLACAYGLVPNLEPARLLGAEIESDRVWTDPHGGTSIPQVYAAGEARGVAGLEAALAEGAAVGAAAAGDPDPVLEARARHERAFGEALERAFALRPELRDLPTPETLLCRCEDVRWGDIAPFAAWRETKLVTRCGMGPCQGRICGEALRFLKGWGPTEARGPLVPIPLAALASPRSFDIERSDAQHY